MPKADLLVSSSHFAAKAAGAHFDGPHLSYCYSPMRYAWRPDLEDDRLGGPSAVVGRAARPALRAWDRWSARQADTMIAISRSISDRIHDAYGINAPVIHPPVDVDRFATVIRSDQPSHYLCFGRLVGYKRMDLAVQACTKAGLPLVVAGDGPELPRLRAMAGPSVRFEQNVTDSRYLELLSDSIALLFPGEEDFGIVPVEAMAAGVPVVAFGRGGALDTVIDGVTGVLFADQTPESLMDAVHRSSGFHVNADKLRAHSCTFSPGEFYEAFRSVCFTAEPLSG